MSSPMKPLVRGKRFKLYYAQRGGFVNPGIYLWTGKRHWRIVPLSHAKDDRTVDLSWVTETKTVDAIEADVVTALDANPGWKLLHVGIGSGGQTTLTYGWPWCEPHP